MPFLRKNYRPHFTYSEIGGATELIDKLINFWRALHGGKDDLWHVVVPIGHVEKSITRRESNENFLGLWYRMEPLWLEIIAARDNTNPNRLLDYYVGGSAITIILRL